MPLHSSTFGYIQPTDEQITVMNFMRNAAKNYADDIERNVPDGPDRTYILRRLREVAMWVNVALTRDANGAPLLED